MSRFFRSGDSSPSSSEDDEDGIELASELEPNVASDDTGSGAADISDLRVSDNTQVGILNPPSQQWTGHHKDVLLHALLEDYCLNETLQSRHNASRNSPETQAEARAKYLRLVSQLAPLNVLPAELGADEHAITRQTYRDGLGMISRQHSHTAVPPNFRRMLTGGDADGPPHHQSLLSDHPAQNEAQKQRALQAPLRRLLGYNEHANANDLWGSTLHSPPINGLMQYPAGPGYVQSRYHSDFEELRILGHGGYGIVYHARNRLDNQAYAVKKIPLSAARLDRVRERGQREVDEILLELRTLARLNHPNIVRYYSAWVEWTEGAASDTVNHDSFGSQASQTQDSMAGADNSRSQHFRRVCTESSTDGADIVFEHSATPNHQATSSNGTSAEKSDDTQELRRTGTRSTVATVSNETIESIDRSSEVSASIQSTADGAHFAIPTLAVHIQMSLHPLALSDLLSNSGSLQHCYHLDPSVGIATAVLEGLEYLHDEGVVHRDIKPANIFLSPVKSRATKRNCVDMGRCGGCAANNNKVGEGLEMEVCIGDFGLAAVAGPETDISTYSSPVGTAMYRPRISSAVQDMKPAGLDVYALGVVLFELLWRFETRMERQECIGALKEGRYPEGFCEWVGQGRGEGVEVVECIDSMLAVDGEGVGRKELRERLDALVAVPDA